MTRPSSGGCQRALQRAEAEGAGNEVGLPILFVYLIIFRRGWQAFFRTPWFREVPVVCAKSRIMPFHVLGGYPDAMGKHEVMSLLTKDPWLGPETMFLNEQGDRPLEIESIQDLSLVANEGSV